MAFCHVKFMALKRNKITLYNNTSTRLTKLENFSADMASSIPASSNSRFNVVYTLCAVFLLLSLLMQPLFVHANEDELPAIATAEVIDIVDTEDEITLDLLDTIEIEEEQDSEVTDETAISVEELAAPDESALDGELSEFQTETDSVSDTVVTAVSLDEVSPDKPAVSGTATSSASEATVDSLDSATTTLASTSEPVLVSEVLDHTPEFQTSSSSNATTSEAVAVSDNDNNDVATTTLSTTTVSDVRQDFSSSKKEPEPESESVEVSTSTIQEIATSTASSTPDNVDPTVVQFIERSSPFSFNETECTTVDDGSFYCKKNSSDSSFLKDDLFAAPDSDGDLELFLRRNNIEQKITDNLVDDSSPYYDAVSHTIVWHRLIDDRYQIVAYDVDSGEEQVLTTTSVNNMQPTRAGNTTVWQRWIDNNWEIMLLESGSLSRLTESPEHDIAPHVRGSLVIWNVRASDGSQSLMTYDTVSKTYNEISDSDGVAVSNPRMVVVYDAIYGNGDTATKGFDLVTGEIIPLGQLPVELPDKLPEPESTGETRALVAPSAPKVVQDETEEVAGPDPTIDTNFENEDPAVGTLDLSTSATSAATTSTSALGEDFDLDLSTPNIPVVEELYSDDDTLILDSSTTTSTSSQSQ